MHNECLVAEYESREEARTGLEVLETYDFTADSVSVVTLEDEESIKRLEDIHQDMHAGHSGGKGTGLGTLLGGTVATPIALFTMVGPFFLAGPLAGMAVGAAVGGLLGGTRHWGVNEQARRFYLQRVEAGSVLVIVTADDPLRLSDAEHGLKTTNTISLERFAYRDLGTA